MPTESAPVPSHGRGGLANADAEHHAGHHLEDPATAAHATGAERDRRGDRCEERLRVTEQVVGDQPREPRREAACAAGQSAERNRMRASVA